MAERQPRLPTVAIAPSWTLSQEREVWCKQALRAAGFNVIDASSRLSQEEIPSHVMAAAGVVILNQEAEGHPYRVRGLNGAMGAVVAAGTIEPPVPVFLMASPDTPGDQARITETAAPCVTIGENFSAIHEILRARPA